MRLINTPEFKKILYEEISAVEAFVAQQSLNLDTQISALNDQWGIEIGATEPGHYAGVSRPELEDLQASLVECAQQIQLLHRFVRVNTDALARILDKAVFLDSPEDWSSEFSARAKSLNPGTRLLSLNITLRHIRDSIKHKTGTSPRSLLLERAGAHFLPIETVQWIVHDDASRLKIALNTSYPEESPERWQVIARLSKTAAVHSSHACLKMLMRNIQTTSQPCGFNDFFGDFLHGMVQNLARLPDIAFATDVFRKILKSVHLDPLALLQHRDQLGRLPLHYAAFLGLEAICREILETMHDDHAIFAKDSFRKTSLDYAVEQGHTNVVEIFLSASQEQHKPASSLLATAIRSKSVGISQLFLQHQWGVEFTSKRGESVLHLAAEQGLSTLICEMIGLGVQIDAQETTRGWTPLTIACVQGHDDVVLALLQAGADMSIRDHQGWLAKDHAAYRGHTRIVNSISLDGSTNLASNNPRVSNILPQRSLTDSVIFVNLGTLDLFKPTPHVDVSQYQKRIFPVQIPDTEFSLSISLAGDTKQEHVIQLPFISDNSDCPLCFTTDDPDNAVLVFKLVNTLESKTVGTAIALLSSLNGGLGKLRESLIRDFTVPLFHHRHSHVGNVVFTFVVARPYGGATLPPKEPQTLNMETTTIVGGHRGERFITDSCQDN